MKKLTTLLFALSFGVSLWAYDFTSGGLFYNILSDSTVELTYQPSPGGSRPINYSNQYTTSITILPEVTYNKITYKVVSIGYLAFKNCSALDSIIIPDGIVEIGEQAFGLCYALKTVSLPNSITSIGPDAFNAANKIAKTIYRGDIENWCKIKFSTWESNPVCQSKNLYINNQLVTEVIIPNTIDSILKYTFCRNAAIESIKISKNVKSIDRYAFSECTNLATIEVQALVPPTIDTTSFTSKPICYVPCGTINEYSKTIWKTYTHTLIENASLYDITVSSSSSAYGVAKVSSRPDCESAIITAIPNEGCTFVKWSDGNTQAIRYLELTEDITLTAYFAKEGYTIHVYQDCNITIK